MTDPPAMEDIFRLVQLFVDDEDLKKALINYMEARAEDYRSLAKWRLRKVPSASAND